MLQDGTCSAQDGAPDTCDLVSFKDYDSLGRVSSESVPDAETHLEGEQGLFRQPPAGLPATVTGYEAMGRPQQVIATDGSVTQYIYLSGEKQVIDAKQRTTRTLLDSRGRVQQVIAPEGLATQYNYDDMDRLTSATTGGIETQIEYDAGGRKTRLADADMGTWVYAYDALGNLIRQTDETGSTVWGYDARGRLVSETKTVGENNTFVTARSYNSADLLTSIQYPADNAGHLGETVNTTYLNQMAVDNVSSTQGTYLQSTQYDASGRVMQRSLGNGLTNTFIYYPWDGSQESNNGNGQGRLQHIVTGSVQDLIYNYDRLGNITSILDGKAGPQTQAFTYDAINRILSANVTGGSNGLYSENYTYNATTGNLESKGGVSYSYNSPHAHAVTAAGSNSYAYDANGNMITRAVSGATFDLQYDAENRLVQATKHVIGQSDAITTYNYDGSDNRISSSSNGQTIIYIGNLFEWNCSTEVGTKYYYSGTLRIAIREGNILYYPFNDHLGSTSIVTDDEGNGIGEELYKAFGESRFASGEILTTFKYSGQREDNETDLHWINSRYYDPALGRFIQADSLVPEPGDPIAWDKYAYAKNNPVKNSDPSGHCILTGSTPNISESVKDCIDAIKLTIQSYQKGERRPMVLISHAIGLTKKLVDTKNSIDELNEDVSITFSDAPLSERLPHNIRLGGFATLTAGAIVGAAQLARAPFARSILQGQVNNVSSELASNPQLASNVLLPAEYQAGVNSSGVARMEYGNAVERMVADKVRNSSILDSVFEHVGGPGNPDFVGRGIFRGLKFEITTTNPSTIVEHLSRAYGEGLNIATYNRPVGFTTLP